MGKAAWSYNQAALAWFNRAVLIEKSRLTATLHIIQEEEVK